MLRLIIAEDEEIIRRGLVCTIDWERLGVTVVGDAADGEEALVLIHEKKPDIVLTDIRMPRLSGLALAKRLQEERSAARVVFLTSYADFDYAQQAVRLGAADYLLKPVEEEALARTLARLRARAEGDVVPEGVCAELGDWTAYQNRAKGNPYVRAVLQTIQERYRVRLSIEAIAAEQGVSTSYLSRKVKEATGQTFGELLTVYRLQRSTELLREGRLRVYEIAERVGFGDYKNFAQVFKKLLHTTPKAFMQEAEKASCILLNVGGS